jgi:hypothetical protein
MGKLVKFINISRSSSRFRGKLGNKNLQLFVGLVFLVGCTTQIPLKPSFPPLSFAPRGEFVFDAERLEIVNNFQTTLEAPHIEHLVPLAPERALRQWADERLAGKGQQGAIRFEIIEASFLEQQLPRTQGLQGVFTKDESQLYTVRLEVKLLVDSPPRLASGTASARVERSRSISEDSSLNDREKLWYQLVREAMEDFDRQISKNIDSDLRLLMF